MDQQWKTAALGGLIGAAVSLVIVFGAGSMGYLPGQGDAHIHQYLMAHPGIIYDMKAKADAEQAAADQASRQAAVDKLGLKRFFDPSVAYVTGPANAKNTFVEFFDYNCGHCRNTFPAVWKFYNAHKNDTRFAFIDYPIFGDASTAAARVAVAARHQGDRYLALYAALMSEGDTAINHDILFADMKKSGIDIMQLSKDLADPAVEKSLAAAHRLAEESKIDGTPMFIINGKVHEGEITDAELASMLKKG